MCSLIKVMSVKPYFAVCNKTSSQSTAQASVVCGYESIRIKLTVLNPVTTEAIRLSMSILHELSFMQLISSMACSSIIMVLDCSTRVCKNFYFGDLNFSPKYPEQSQRRP